MLGIQCLGWMPFNLQSLHNWNSEKDLNGVLWILWILIFFLPPFICSWVMYVHHIYYSAFCVFTRRVSALQLIASSSVHSPWSWNIRFQFFSLLNVNNFFMTGWNTCRMGPYLSLYWFYFSIIGYRNGATPLAINNPITFKSCICLIWNYPSFYL